MKHGHSKDAWGHLAAINTDSGIVGRATFEPGWRWSKHVKAIAGTHSCQAAHTCYFVSGRIKVAMDDGEDIEYGPGDFAYMAPGHDAWTVGDEPCVVVNWQGFSPTTRNADRSDGRSPDQLRDGPRGSAARSPSQRCSGPKSVVTADRCPGLITVQGRLRWVDMIEACSYLSDRRWLLLCVGALGAVV
jgi:quercetin dioxygenase-like cupin family protein